MFLRLSVEGATIMKYSEKKTSYGSGVGSGNRDKLQKARVGFGSKFRNQVAGTGLSFV